MMLKLNENRLLQRSRIPLLALLAGGVLLLALLLQPLSGSALRAAGAVVSLELQDIVFNGCTDDVISGSFRVVAYDSSGAVANDGVAVETIRYYATSYSAVTLQQASTSSQAQNFLIAFGGDPISYATLTVVLASNPTVQSTSYYLDCNGNTVSPVAGLDDRINPGMGDLIAVLYTRYDQRGNPVIQVWRVLADGEGEFIDSYPNSLFAPYLAEAPAEVEKLGSIGATTLYAVPDGSFQINIGPDIEGKITSVIFTGLPPRKVHKREFNLYNLGQ